MKNQAAKQPKPATTVPPTRSGILQRKCACGGNPGPTGECAECRRKKRLGINGTPLQPKLRIGRPDDPLEREADRVADLVMRMPEPKVQKQPDEEEELLQTKPLVQRRVSGLETGLEEAPPIVHEVLRSPGRPLDPATRAFFEPRFGYDFGRVRVHTGLKAAEAAEAINAKAFTVGRDVVFGKDEYAPGSGEGKRLLGHELVHVGQEETNLTTVRRNGGSILTGIIRARQNIQRATNYTQIRFKFDGINLIAYGDGNKLFQVEAYSGKPVPVKDEHIRQCRGQEGEKYLNNNRYVGIKNYGPIPEGEFYFHPSRIQRFSFLQQAQLLLGGIQGETVDINGQRIHGGDWGSGRVPLRKERIEARNVPCGNPRSRSGFFLHGGSGLPLEYSGHTFGLRVRARGGVHEQAIIGETLVGEAQARSRAAASEGRE
ncbi:MAG TPA: DUF4157 domain-containing protein, partial [Thiotrichales bacterium]|nr:DUF4157 domain-containing protein [Thiotrichales bacterium]